MTLSADNALLNAAGIGNLDGVEVALNNGANVNARGEFGDSALNLAAQRGHKDMVLRLVEHGADVENVGGADMTPIMNASFTGNIGIVRLLLSKGAKVTDDLIRGIRTKVDILEENAESGMVRPDAVEAWKQFLQFLVNARSHQP